MSTYYTSGEHTLEINKDYVVLDGKTYKRTDVSFNFSYVHFDNGVKAHMYTFADTIEEDDESKFNVVFYTPNITSEINGMKFVRAKK